MEPQMAEDADDLLWSAASKSCYSCSHNMGNTPVILKQAHYEGNRAVELLKLQIAD